MNQKVIFHLGAHRTGSTYIQEVFAANRSLFDNEDIFFEYFHEVKGLRKTAIKARKLARQENNEAFKASFQPVANYLTRTCSKPNQTVFLSYEGLLGEIDLSASRLIYPASRTILEEVKSVIQDKDVTLAFCVRNYTDFIESTYKYNVRDGISKKFDAYLDDIDLDNVSWLPVIEALVDVFGKSKVLVWSFENFANNPSNIINWMFLKAGINSSFLSALDFPKKSANASASQKALDIMLEIAPVISSYAAKTNIKAKQTSLLKKIFSSIVKLSLFTNRNQNTQEFKGRKLKRELNAILEDALPVSEFGKAELLSNSTKLMLNKKYENDLAIIKELLVDNVRL